MKQYAVIIAALIALTGCTQQRANRVSSSNGLTYSTWMANNGFDPGDDMAMGTAPGAATGGAAYSTTTQSTSGQFNSTTTANQVELDSSAPLFRSETSIQGEDRSLDTSPDTSTQIEGGVSTKSGVDTSVQTPGVSLDTRSSVDIQGRATTTDPSSQNQLNDSQQNQPSPQNQDDLRSQQDEPSSSGAPGAAQTGASTDTSRSASGSVNAASQSGAYTQPGQNNQYRGPGASSAQTGTSAAQTGVSTDYNRSSQSSVDGARNQSGISSQTSTDTSGATQPQSANDMELSRRVKAAIGASDSGISGAQGNTTSFQNIQVTAQNGKVTLRGTVQSEAQKRQLEMKAKQQTGVSTVVNELKVQGAAGTPGQSPETGQQSQENQNDRPQSSQENQSGASQQDR